MGNIIRSIERGLIVIFIVLIVLVSGSFWREGYSSSVWLEAYFFLCVGSFCVYRLLFRSGLRKLHTMNDAIRLGVCIPEDTNRYIRALTPDAADSKQSTDKKKRSASYISTIKINNRKLFDSNHYRIQVTERIVNNLKRLECCGKKVCRVASSYTVFWVDHPMVLIDGVRAFRDNKIIAEVFHRRLLQLDTADCAWLTADFNRCLKGVSDKPLDDARFLASLCEKIVLIYTAYEDEDKACEVIGKALQAFIAHNIKLAVISKLLKERIRGGIGDSMQETALQKIFD